MLAAFGNYRLLWNSNNYTKDIANGIQPYWVMWVMSVLDLYDATANVDQLREFAPWIEQRLDHAETILQAWDSPDDRSEIATGLESPCCASPSLDWSRDDDRMGFGFETPNLPEAQRAFRALLIGASARYSKLSLRPQDGLVMCPKPCASVVWLTVLVLLFRQLQRLATQAPHKSTRSCQNL